MVAALLWCAGADEAHAELKRHEIRLAPGLDIELLHGYPQTRHSAFAPITIGLVTRNRGPERSLRVRIDGELQAERTLRLRADETSRSFLYLASPSTHVFLDATFTDELTGKQDSRSLPSPSITNEPIARLGNISAAFNVSDPWVMIGALDGYVPDSWRGLSGLRALVMELPRFERLGDDRQVLMDWVAAGGLMIVVTPEDRMDALPALTDVAFAGTPSSVPAGVHQRVGHGAVVHVAPGEVASVDQGFLGRIGSCERCGFIADPTTVYGQPYEDLLDARLAGVTGRASLGLFLVLLAFALAVGPVGWHTLVSRRRLPLHYVAFVMASAVVFSAGVLAADVVAQGLSPKGQESSLRIVDQRHDREIGVEELAIYPPSSRGTVLSLPATHLPLLPRLPRDGVSRPPVRHSIEGDDQVIEGAIDVRFRRLVGARWLAAPPGRLEIRRRGDGLAVENHLGQPVESLLVWHDGRLYAASGIAKGEQALAVPTEASSTDSARAPLPTGFVLQQSVDLVEALVQGELGENRYYATLGRTPGASDLIGEALVEVGPSTHVVAGVYR